MSNEEEMKEELAGAAVVNEIVEEEIAEEVVQEKVKGKGANKLQGSRKDSGVIDEVVGYQPNEIAEAVAEVVEEKKVVPGFRVEVPYLNVRSGPRSDAVILTVVEAGDILEEVKDKMNFSDYHKVRVNRADTQPLIGYVIKLYVRKIG